MNTQTNTVSPSLDLEIEIMDLCTCDGPWGQQACDIHRDIEPAADAATSMQDELYWLGQHY